MRFGNRRGATLALGCASALLLTLTLFSTPARAQFHHIPRTVEAIDLNTGGPYYAPPVPYGHYAKDPGAKAGGLVHGLLGKAHGLGGGLGHGTGCGACGGKGCGLCGGMGGGHGHGNDGACDTCGTGGGLFGKHKNGGLGGCGLCGGAAGSCGHASTVLMASPQGIPTPQAPMVLPTAQSICGDPGCGLGGMHKHKGCGLCGGSGLFKGKGCHGCASADPCGGCGGKGCGLCGKGGGSGCGACGGKGCGLCGGLGHAKGLVHGAVNHLLGRDKIKWFVGPGGPVPLTPGYTPYINVTRSPRDFFAFPPFTQ